MVNTYQKGKTKWNKQTNCQLNTGQMIVQKPYKALQLTIVFWSTHREHRVPKKGTPYMLASPWRPVVFLFLHAIIHQIASLDLTEQIETGQHGSRSRAGARELQVQVLPFPQDAAAGRPGTPHGECERRPTCFPGQWVQYVWICWAKKQWQRAETASTPWRTETKAALRQAYFQKHALNCAEMPRKKKIALDNRFLGKARWLNSDVALPWSVFLHLLDDVLEKILKPISIWYPFSWGDYFGSIQY